MADRRFLESGSALARLGIPADVILDEWEGLVTHTDDIAARFIALFESHLAPADWQQGSVRTRPERWHTPLLACRPSPGRC